MRPFLLPVVLLLSVVSLGGAPWRVSSGPARTALVELYTSEGCSSPPAERWFSSLRSSPGLWRDFVPVAFHVDYWNRLGWPDRFSKPEFTARQSAYASRWGSGQVYTPCAVTDGAESKPGLAPAMATGDAGVLSATYDGERLDVAFAPPSGAPARAFDVHAAILGAGAMSRVTAGENSGKTLRQDFVALVLVEGRLGAPLALKLPAVAGVPQRALAVWITRRGENTPLQAAGGWLEGGEDSPAAGKGSEN